MNETLTLEHLNRWKIPSNYSGETWPEYYSSGIGQHRDSDPLERANFEAMILAIGDESDTVIIVRENHWAVGWIEWVAIHESDSKALLEADRIMEALEDYPVIDDEIFSRIEDEECASIWENCYNEIERGEYLRTHLSSVVGHFRALRAAIKGDWHYAANLLPCPSDLI